MSQILCANVTGGLAYAMMCTKPDISFAVGMVHNFKVTQDLFIESNENDL